MLRAVHKIRPNSGGTDVVHCGQEGKGLFRCGFP